MLYEALAGHAPGARRPARPRPPGGSGAGRAAAPHHRPDLPDELCAALDRALLADPEQRGTLADLGDALEGALIDLPDDDGTIVQHPVERPSLLPPVPRRAPRSPTRRPALSWPVRSAFLGPSAHVPWPAALAAVALVVLLPRLGWLVVPWGDLGAGRRPRRAGRQGRGVGRRLRRLLLLAAAPVPFLLARSPRSWSMPVLAPLLGAVGMAAAYPALAGRATRVLERAALGALGALWLLLAEPLTGNTLLLGPAADAPTGLNPQEAVRRSPPTRSASTSNCRAAAAAGDLGDRRGGRCRGSCAGAASPSTW